MVDKISNNPPCAIPGDEGIFATRRTDWWWVQPLLVALGLSLIHI